MIQKNEVLMFFMGHPPILLHLMKKKFPKKFDGN